MRFFCLIVCVALLPVGSGTARAGELRVHYLVDARALRNLAPLQDTLSFELYADRECRVTLHREAMSALEVARSNVMVRPASNVQAFARRKAVEIGAVLRLQNIPQRSYLRVRGPGIRPLGSGCQVQQLGI